MLQPRALLLWLPNVPCVSVDIDIQKFSKTTHFGIIVTTPFMKSPNGVVSKKSPNGVF
jgi:hypothetical protein